jgi:hypothetical protein
LQLHQPPAFACQPAISESVTPGTYDTQIRSYHTTGGAAPVAAAAATVAAAAAQLLLLLLLLLLVT